MATYFHQNSEIQAPDGLQTLVLMNPGYVQYPADAQPPGGSNLVFLNSASAPAPTSHLSHMLLQPPQQTQQFVGIPLSASAASLNHSVPAVQEISPLHGLFPRFQYNLWNSVEPSTAASETPRAAQSQQGGLSLSLSSQQPPGLRSFRSEREPAQPAASGGGGGGGGSPSSASGVTHNGGALGIQGVLLSSKYLKAVQELLDDVVNVGSGINKADTSKKARSSGQSKAAGESSSSALAAPGKEEDGSGKAGATELSTAERQEIQMKRAKLISMIDEVEQRYRQYHHQMQIVVSSFEQAAGTGSAKTYTALALQTISKQFRCLKDAIAGQIKSTNKSLGEEEDSPGEGKIIEGSRLKFVDNQIRQQRALQQLGMIQNNPWRPQRGLPERSVSILRAWLFEHFLHPYPKDSDKHMLAKQTGLTRSQVSNWFINARVRLWKPMVEEMYVEEMKEHGQNGVDEKIGSKSVAPGEDSASKSSSTQDEGSPSKIISSNSFNKSKETDPMTQDAPAISNNSGSSVGGNIRVPPGFAPIRSSELEGITEFSPKKPRSSEVLHSPSEVPSLEDRDGYSIMGGPTNFIGGFGQYPIGEIGRFGAEQFVPSPTFAGNAVSLTLGLPHTENLSLSMDHHRAFLPSQNIHMGRRLKVGEGNEFGAINNPIAPPHSSATYEGINLQDRKRLAAQLLPDFVA